MFHRKTAGSSSSSSSSSLPFVVSKAFGTRRNDDGDASKKSNLPKVVQLLNFKLLRDRGWTGEQQLGLLVTGVSLILILLLRCFFFSTTPLPPDDPFDLTPQDHMPSSEMESLIRIDALEDMQEGVIPLVVQERREKETRAQKELRLLGNRALMQHGDRLRNLVLAAPDLFSMTTTRQSTATTASPQRLRDLAPWLPNDNWPFPTVPTDDPTSQALVIYAGDHQFDYLDALLHTIRVVHHSTMTVHVTYSGDDDLSPKSRQTLLQSYPQNLHFIDLAAILDLEAAKLKGWNLRIFGLLLVPQAHVAMLDVDVLLLQPPEALFAQRGYKDTGALFFHDRIAPDKLWQPRQLLLRLQPQPSERAKKALTNGYVDDHGVHPPDAYFNEHVQESGVVLIDKTRRSVGLWAACLLVGRWDIRRFAQRDLVYGDKELYWTAFETVNEPYAFANYYPGCIGGVLTDFEGKDQSLTTTSATIGNSIPDDNDNMALCGRLLHLDDTGQPLWSNGGYLTKEDDKDTSQGAVSKNGLQPILFIDGGSDFYGQAGKPGLNQYWKYHEGMGVTCLYPNANKIRQVPAAQAQNGLQAVQYYLQRQQQQPQGQASTAILG